MTIHISAIGNGSGGSGGSGASVAQLQAKLKDLYKRVNDLVKDTTMDAKLKKLMQQSLQNQIQMISKQIADIQSQSGKPPPAQETSLKPGDETTSKDKEANTLRHRIDTYV